jgi:hypothetical protein
MTTEVRQDTMSLSARDSRSLARIESQLCAADSKLAGLFDSFTRLSIDEQMPPQERLPGWRHWLLAVLLVPLIVACGLITALSTGPAHAACGWAPYGAFRTASAAGHPGSGSCLAQQHHWQHTLSRR